MSGASSSLSQKIRSDGSVTVVVTVLGDRRVARAIESLLTQTRAPEAILVDDGGGGDEVKTIAEAYTKKDRRVQHLPAPGNIPESRNIALRRITSEFVAFLDADEVAPSVWLEELLRPFQERRVGFTGGPTPALAGTARTVGASYYDAYLRRFYDRIARYRPHALPMGNSAWRVAVFQDVGLLDTTLHSAAASEDQEIALRAIRVGWLGAYAPRAAVAHDFSGLRLSTLLRKQARYAEGGYVVWRRRGSTYEATPLRLSPYIAPPLAVLVGAVLWLLPWTHPLGLLVLLAGGIGFVLLVVVLGVQGLREESGYPGFKYRPVEILRRWATLWGAARGLLRYGWRGRRPRVPSSGSRRSKR